MTKTFVFSGASDDLIHVDGSDEFDEIGAQEATFVVAGTEGRFARIRVNYGRRGLWEVTVGPLDEDIPMLPVLVEMDTGYSARATVHNALTVLREGDHED